MNKYITVARIIRSIVINRLIINELFNGCCFILDSYFYLFGTQPLGAKIKSYGSGIRCNKAILQPVVFPYLRRFGGRGDLFYFYLLDIFARKRNNGSIIRLL